MNSASDTSDICLQGLHKPQKQQTKQEKDSWLSQKQQYWNHFKG